VSAIVCTGVLGGVDRESLASVVEFLKQLNARIEGNTLVEPVDCGGFLLMALPTGVFSELASALGSDPTCTWGVGDKCIALVDDGLVKALGLTHEPVELACEDSCSARVLAPEWRLIGGVRVARIGDYYILCYNNNCI